MKNRYERAWGIFRDRAMNVPDYILEQDPGIWLRLTKRSFDAVDVFDTESQAQNKPKSGDTGQPWHESALGRDCK